MNRLVSLLLAAALLLALCSCGAAPAQTAAEGPVVVTTIFPLYDWVTQLSAGLPADVTLLMDSGMDMHSFQPSTADIVKASSCDLFIYVGGESDAWVEDALAEAVNPDMIVLDLLDILGDSAREEELLEGMEPEAEEDEAAYDEHVWLSLKNARVFCAAIGEALSSLDPENADSYAANAAAYDKALTELDARFRSAVDAAPLDTLLFGDRFPFLYLAEDYGLSCYAAFAGCSAETEASFETIAFLSGKVDELRLPAVLTIDGSDGRIAETIIQNTAEKTAQILTLDSMQSVTEEDIAAGATYLDIMEADLAVLTAALNG